MEENSNIITLIGENGENVNFEFIDLIEYAGYQYVVLLPIDDPEDKEVVILMVDPDEDSEEEIYLPIKSERTLHAVFDLFKKRNKDYFDFID